ncbi:MAG: hypothetical protein K0R76_1250 [Alphaproteobacteria bacterium]|jgi:hypothetical protein|nr:hypothetical protein [Alphaproteobacteria bacterium]
MEIFFSKNRAGIAMASLILAGAMAMQVPASEGGKLPEASSPLEKMADDFSPLEMREQCIQKEWQRLDDTQDDEGVSVAPYPGIPQLNEPGAGREDQLSRNQEIPVRFGAKAIVIKPGFVRTTLNFDNDEKPAEPEDPTDPTSKGTGPGGGHKGGPKATQLHTIPIIRMGDNSQEHRGFKVINNPWNS